MPAMHIGSEDHRLASGKASRKKNKRKKNPTPANHIGQIRLVTLQVWSRVTIQYGNSGVWVWATQVD